MKNALIWGGASAIGQAFIAKLSNEGWITIAVARDIIKVTPAADFGFEANFEIPASVEKAVYSIAQEIEQVDLWCYAAGDILAAKVEQMSPTDWERIITANLSGAYNTYHFSQPLLSEDAHVFFLGAVSERLQLPGLSAYAAAKAGLEAFATALSKEERKKRITVVRPGAVATPFWDKVPLRLPADAASPEKVAVKIYEAYVSGHKGQLDLV